MIRQEQFNNFIQAGRLSPGEMRSVAALYVAHTLGRELNRRRVNLQMNVEGKIISLSGFKAGDDDLYPMIEYWDDMDRGLDNGWLRLGDDIRFRLVNAWKKPKEELKEGEEPKEQRRSARRPGDRLDASRHMHEADIQILRSMYNMVTDQALELMRGFYKSMRPERPTKELNVGDTVYILHEDDRLTAAWEVLTTGLTIIEGQRMRDTQLMHITTGEVEFGFSGDFGNEQEWVKARSRTRNGPREEPLPPSAEEKEFFDYVVAQIKERRDNPDEPNRERDHRL